MLVIIADEKKRAAGQGLVTLKAQCHPLITHRLIDEAGDGRIVCSARFTHTSIPEWPTQKGLFHAV